ncbi:hypothetical protein [Listeria monocytogenes]|uniref:Uncharacterized protein n=1 Tax=Listeria monocytogenes TaxID=1639 RepID=A0A6C8N1J2_LISMN|nr:hypothetical protein [Listeria monocytogenes]KAA9534105.1 hypothetical protein DCK33_08160 [Listeria monocytogenes]KAA9541470.1 hypothetical protein DCK32_10305 [Listeria monocytogenes]
MKIFQVDDEIYIARVLSGLRFIGSFYDEQQMIKAHLHLVGLFKTVDSANIEEFKTKDTEMETMLYKGLLKANGNNTSKVPFGKVIELAICALNANDGITADNITHLLSNRLIYTVSGFYEYQIADIINWYFDEDMIITRKLLDEFCEFVMKLGQEVEAE